MLYCFLRSVYTDKYGINQRFAAVTTNAELRPDPVNTTVSAASFCRECMKCVNECPLDALKVEKMIDIELGGTVIQYLPLDSIRCEWESKYALCGECGFKYVGSTTTRSLFLNCFGDIPFCLRNTWMK